MLRVLLMISFVLGFAVGPSHAQSEQRHAPPPRLTRPAPHLPQTPTVFTPSLAASIRLQALQVSLSALALREQKRFLPAALQLVVAAGFGTAAAFVDDPGLRASFSLASAVIGTGSIIQFAAHANMPDIAANFAAIAPKNRGAVLYKLRVGELGLLRAARVGRRQRILAGCLGAIGAVAYLPVQYALARRENEDHRFGSSSGDYVGLSLSLIGLAAALVHAIRHSVPEQHYEAYRLLRHTIMTLPTQARPLP